MKVVGVDEGCKQAVFSLLSTFAAPPRQACPGEGLVGMMVLWTFLSLT